MSSPWITGALVGVAGATLSTLISLRIAVHPEARLAALQRLFAIAAVACTVTGIAILAAPQLPLVPLAADASANDPEHVWLRLARDELAAQRSTTALLLFAAAWLLAPVIVVLRSVRTFVLQHRLDLAARDAIAAQGDRKLAS